MEEDAEVAKFLPGNNFAADYRCFAECLANAGAVREGYWSIFVTLGWISTRSERFVATIQDFEVANHAQRGAIFTAASWFTLDKAAMKDFGGKSFVEAEAELKEALEMGRIAGGIATRIGAVNPEPIECYQWTAWHRTFDLNGLVLIPGFHDFKWSSEQIRAAFSAKEVNASEVVQFIPTGAAGAPNQESEILNWAEAAFARGVTIPNVEKDWRDHCEGEKPQRETLRNALKECRKAHGVQTKPGRAPPKTG